MRLRAPLHPPAAVHVDERRLDAPVAVAEDAHTDRPGGRCNRVDRLGVDVVRRRKAHFARDHLEQFAPVLRCRVRLQSRPFLGPNGKERLQLRVQHDTSSLGVLLDQFRLQDEAEEHRDGPVFQRCLPALSG